MNDTTIVSYEHSIPLRYDDIDQIREECRRGFEPDRLPDGSEEVTWSRGTRVFQRTNGRWMMTHQHVSFPIDPSNGIAATDLKP